MSGKAMAIVGMRGMGKSTIAKNMLAKVHPGARIVYDPNGEYKELYDKPLLPFDKFAERMPKIRNAVILVEEATIFLNNRGFNFDFLDVVVRARHNNNTIILVFHSFSAVPKYLMSLFNYVIILKTGDPINKIEQFENPALTKAFLQIRNAPLLKSKEGKEYSPNLVFDLYNPKNFADDLRP